jgi:hypothetical protein
MPNCPESLPPTVGQSACKAGTTWTLAEELKDIASEIEAKRAGYVWCSDGGNGSSILGHLGPDGAERFVDLLRSGRLRAAVEMVADAAFRCGLREARRLYGANRIAIDPDGNGGLGSVTIKPQKIPPEAGVVYSHGMGAKLPRAQMDALLKKGGIIKIGNMKQAIHLPPIGKNDREAMLKGWPFGPKPGRPRKPPAK